jgi:hypothetical protein
MVGALSSTQALPRLQCPLSPIDHRPNIRCSHCSSKHNVSTESFMSKNSPSSSPQDPGPPPKSKTKMRPLDQTITISHHKICCQKQKKVVLWVFMGWTRDKSRVTRTVSKHSCKSESLVLVWFGLVWFGRAKAQRGLAIRPVKMKIHDGLSAGGATLISPHALTRLNQDHAQN